MLGAVSILAGSGREGYRNGNGKNAFFNFPTGIEIDQQTGNIFVSDYGNHTIRRITQKGEVFTLAGSPDSGFCDGHGTAAKFNCPWGLVLCDSSLLVCDELNSTLRHVSLNGDVSTFTHVKWPSFIVSVSNSFLVTSNENGKMYKVTRKGTSSVLEQLEGSEKREMIFNHPTGLVVHEPSSTCLVIQTDKHKILELHFAL